MERKGMNLGRVYFCFIGRRNAFNVIIKEQNDFVIDAKLKPDKSFSSPGNENVFLNYQSNISGLLWRFPAHIIFFNSSLYLAEGGDSSVRNHV